MDLHGGSRFRGAKVFVAPWASDQQCLAQGHEIHHLDQQSCDTAKHVSASIAVMLKCSPRQQKLNSGAHP